MPSSVSFPGVGKRFGDPFKLPGEVCTIMKRYAWRTALSILVLGILVSAGRAQGTREDYKRAEQFLPGNLRHRLYVADVAPHWIAKTNRFWYRKASPKGVEFLLVDLSQSTTRPAFDQERLATALSKVSKRDYKPTELPFDTLEFSEDG